MMSDYKVGDEVEVVDDGLAMLRRLCPGLPPNHHGRIQSIDNRTVFVEFPINGSYEHSQVAPYDVGKIKKR